MLKKLFSNIPLGTWFNIPVYLNFSWIILLAYYLIVDSTFAIGWAILFIIVLMHEFGHVFAGKYCKCFASSVVLYPLGGVATMKIPFNKPKQELLITIAGPLVNLLLVPIFYFVAPFHPILTTVGTYNICMLIFNLLPIIPLDGGRILRSLLTLCNNNWVHSTRIAANVSQFMSIFLVLLGILALNPILVLIGCFTYLGSIMELKEAEKQFFEAQNPLFTQE